jgi:hypothetical protein
MSKGDYIGGLESGAFRYLAFHAVSEIGVRVYAQSAVVRYQARIDIEFPPHRDSGLFWHIDLYELKGGLWQAVWSQATRIAG